MKSILVILATAALCTFSPVQADEACCAQVSIQARIREIDLNVLLKQYEEVQTELTKMKVQIALLDSDESRSDAERKQTIKNYDRRRQALQMLRDEFVAQMEKLASIEVASK